MKKTTYYIVRHGETIGNTQKIIQGHSDTELTEKGIAQAHAIRDELSHINFAAAYSSDLGLYGNLRLMSNDAKGWFFFGSEKDDHGKQKHEAKVFFNYGYGIFRW